MEPPILVRKPDAAWSLRRITVSTAFSASILIFDLIGAAKTAKRRLLEPLVQYTPNP
jgi:hypothetical protein